MFTKRHEQELSEIRGLVFELGQRTHEILQQLEVINGRMAQVDVEGPGPKAKGARKVRRQQAVAPVRDGGSKPGKGRRAAAAVTSADGPDAAPGEKGRGSRKAAGRRGKRRSAEKASGRGGKGRQPVPVVSVSSDQD